MKDTPILFTSENVRAIFDGRKTQTRRLNGLKKFNRQPDRWRLEGSTFAFDGGFEYVPVPNCPYGQPGDRLWVRETWAVDRCYDHMKPSAIPASRPAYYYHAKPNHIVENWHKKRPSIFMPRWACRLWLELTEVRVERLQECSEADAIAEGIECVGGPTSCNPWRNYRIGQPGEMNMHCSAPSRSYMTLWESINGEGSWEANPWVWVLTFKRVTNG